jgi:hypothetical protein
MSAGDSKPAKSPDKHGEGVNARCGPGEKHRRRNRKWCRGENDGGNESENIAAMKTKESPVIFTAREGCGQ